MKKIKTRHGLKVGQIIEEWRVSKCDVVKYICDVDAGNSRSGKNKKTVHSCYRNSCSCCNSNSNILAVAHSVVV